MKTLSRYSLAACLGFAVLAACKDLDVPNLNSPDLGDFQNNPTRSQVLSVATGLLLGTRNGIAPQNGYVSLLGILGRESYNFDPADPRFVTEMLLGPLDGGSPAFGGNLWANPYRNIRNANLELAALEKVPLVNDAEKESMRGFTQTIQALDYLKIISSRDSNGAPIPTSIDPLAPPAPVASRDSVYAHIVRLLDSAAKHLDSATTLTGGPLTFPFELSPGFDGFTSTASFRKANRALMARVQAYKGSFGCAACWDSALTALSGSFIAPSGDLNLGVYYSYSTVSGDEVNALFDPQARAIVTHPSVVADAQLQTGGAKDDRVFRKVATLTDARTAQGLSSQYQFVIYGSNIAPIPIIRNEELILLRAEANIGKGGAADLVAAVADLDTVRVRSGKLPLYSGAVTQAALLDELLYNRRYSLMFEGGHRWIDARRYGRLGTLPQDATTTATAKRFTKFPFPAFECDPRSPPPSGCGTQAGF
jgi:starch-binding outer membrane protein, SusD/RagB family